ncbi:hypothetical protein LguiB_018624 [Lonicera macranthoides]
MVWFQCEDCGDSLKKPKLTSHFRVCSANKLSCIDCGETFGQQSVQGHTQCITETEKYGPKGQNKASNCTTPKPKSDSKQKPEVDINVGLSERPPWFCSLCNTQATSRQTLLLHAEGKKHKAKARAFHASKEPPKQTEESTPITQVPNENNQKTELPENENVEESKEPNQSKLDPVPIISEAESGKSKKRKLDGTEQKARGDSSESGNGEVIQVERAEVKEETNHQVKKTKHSVGKEDEAVEPSSLEDESKKKIKWKKLITSALKSVCIQALLQLRKLRKSVLKMLRESGFTEDESQLTEMLERKINSSSRFTIDGKYVRLVAKS